MSKNNPLDLEDDSGAFTFEQAPRDVINAALVEGEESGPPLEFDFDDYIAGKQGSGYDRNVEPLIGP